MQEHPSFNVCRRRLRGSYACFTQQTMKSYMVLQVYIIDNVRQVRTGRDRKEETLKSVHMRIHKGAEEILNHWLLSTLHGARVPQIRLLLCRVYRNPLTPGRGNSQG